MTNDYAEIASFAAELAARSGVRLLEVLSDTQEVEFKDKAMHDPVTALDREIEATLHEAIVSRFPGHGVLGEEGAAAPAGDAECLWVLDPIDGTTNFLNGVPLFAVSIGVLSEGLPVAAAIFLVAGPGGRPGILHAARGQGAFFQPLGEHGEEHKLTIPPRDLPATTGTVGLPAGWAAMYRIAPPLKGRMGQPRSLGSIAMELAYVAAGLFQYTAFGPSRLWDVAAGVLLVREAGGLVLTHPRRRPWQPIERFVPPSGEGTELERLRRWRVSPMIAASPDLAWNATKGLRTRARPLSWLLRLLRDRSG